MNTARAVKIGMAWSTERIFTIGNFIVGLISWNIIVAAGIALAGLLSHYIRD